jgi:hypothetical protein
MNSCGRLYQLLNHTYTISRNGSDFCVPACLSLQGELLLGSALVSCHERSVGRNQLRYPIADHSLFHDVGSWFASLGIMTVNARIRYGGCVMSGSSYRDLLRGGCWCFFSRDCGNDCEVWGIVVFPLCILTDPVLLRCIGS